VSLHVPSLALQEATESDVVRVIALRGELDVSTLKSLSDRLMRIVDAHRCVVLDAMELTFIDSSGMRLLLSALRRAALRDGCLALACANPTVLRLFAVTGMDRTLDVRPSREAAVQAVLQSAHV